MSGYDLPSMSWIRKTAYIHGRALVGIVSTGAHHAHARVGAISRANPPEDTGLEFFYEEMSVPGSWGIYGSPVPYLGDRELWDEDKAEQLTDRLQEWGGPVLVRVFGTSGTTRSTVHRDNTRTRSAYPALDHVRFKSQTIGLGSDKMYGQFAYLDKAYWEEVVSDV